MCFDFSLMKQTKKVKKPSSLSLISSWNVIHFCCLLQLNSALVFGTLGVVCNWGVRSTTHWSGKGLTLWKYQDEGGSFVLASQQRSCLQVRVRTSVEQSADLPGDEWDGAEVGFITPSDVYLWTHVEAAGSRSRLHASTSQQTK